MIYVKVNLWYQSLGVLVNVLLLSQKQIQWQTQYKCNTIYNFNNHKSTII